MFKKSILYLIFLVMSSCLAQDDVSISIENKSIKHIDSIHFVDIRGVVHKIYNIKPKETFEKTIALRGFKNTGEDKLAFSVYVFSKDKVCTRSGGLVDYPYLLLKNSYSFYLFDTGLNNKPTLPNPKFEYWHSISKESLKKLKYYNYTRERYPKKVKFADNIILVPKGFKSLSLNELSNRTNYAAWSYANDLEHLGEKYERAVESFSKIATIHNQSFVKFKSFDGTLEGLELYSTLGNSKKFHYHLKGKVNEKYVYLNLSTEEKINNKNKISLISMFVHERL